MKIQKKLDGDIRLRLLLGGVPRNIREKLLGRYIIDFEDISDENFKDIIYKMSEIARIENEIEDFLN